MKHIPPGLIIVRLIHSFFGLLFLGCIVVIYYSAITGHQHRWLLAASVLLAIEGIILLFNRGHCPMKPLHSKYGDDKGFFGLFLPQSFLPYINWVLFCISLLGFALLYRIN